MPNKIPTAEEFMKKFTMEYGQFHVDDSNKVYGLAAKEFAKMHLRACKIELAVAANKESIMSAYPLSNIK